MKRGFTLAEILMSMGVVILIYALLGFTTIQIARFTRNAGESAQHRMRLLKAAESLRWQLRCLGLSGSTPPLKSLRGDKEGRDQLRFYTYLGQESKGLVEVGYQVREEEPEETGEDPKLLLSYREFPYRIKDGLRSMDDFLEGPWKSTELEVTLFTLEFSLDGQVWQREWDLEDAPRFARVKLKDNQEHELEFEVAIGVSSERW